MNDYYFTFRSITTAQTGSAALHDAGLRRGRAAAIVCASPPPRRRWRPSACGRQEPRTSGSISKPPPGTHRWRWSCDLF